MQEYSTRGRSLGLLFAALKMAATMSVKPAPAPRRDVLPHQGQRERARRARQRAAGILNCP